MTRDEARYLAQQQHIAEELRDALDRRPFGAELAERLWQALIRVPVGDGVIVDYHRDYCGQGLIRRADDVVLCEVEDGGAYTHTTMASWQQKEPFVEFFARQSDFTCSGWDPSEPTFATDDEWHRNNQRLTRKVFERFLADHGG